MPSGGTLVGLRIPQVSYNRPGNLERNVCAKSTMPRASKGASVESLVISTKMIWRKMLTIERKSGYRSIKSAGSLHRAMQVSSFWDSV